MGTPGSISSTLKTQTSHRDESSPNVSIWHCIKSVRIQGYCGPRFPALGLNTERYGVSFRIQSECGKWGP